MKKFISLAILFVIISIELTGCSSSKQDKGKELDKTKLIWSKDLDANDIYTITKIALDGHNNILLTGSSGGKLLFGTYDQDGNRKEVTEYSGMRITGSCLAQDQLTGDIYIVGKGESGCFIVKINRTGEMRTSNKIMATKQELEEDTIGGIAVDKEGNAYIGGCTRALISKPGLTNHVFIIKTNFVGEMQWNANFETEGYHEDSSLSINDSGETYIAEMTYDNKNSNRAIFAAKYNKSGKQLWSQKIALAQPNSQVYAKVLVDPNGFVYVASLYQSTEPNQFLVVHKIDPMAGIIWEHKTTRLYAARLNAITRDKDDNIYVAGSNNNVFDKDKKKYYGEAFFIKFNSQGQVNLLKKFGTETPDSCYAICGDGGFIYTTVRTSGVYLAEQNKELPGYTWLAKWKDLTYKFNINK